MSQLYVFTGENAYALREEKQRWREQFKAKYGDENCTRLLAQGMDVRSLLDEVAVAPFIAAKRLVFVDGIPKLSAEDIEVLQNQIHPDCVLVFVDPKPDKRTVAVKALLKIADVKEFGPVNGAPLRIWMNIIVREWGSALSDEAARALLELTGDDQDLLYGELTKLSLYAHGRTITSEDIEALSMIGGEREVWALFSLLSAGKEKEAMGYIRALLDRGEDTFALWSMLLWMLRHLVSVWAAFQAGERNPASIASQFQVPFPTVKTLLPSVHTIDRASLLSLVEWATDTDIQLKTGGYKSTQEAPQELQTLIDRFVLKSVEAVGGSR